MDLPFGSTHDLDPRVGALVDWAQSSSEKLDETGAAALAALEQSPPRAATSPSLALIATAAYARVPTVGPRDLQTGHRIVELLSMLDEAGARELVRLRERAYYAFARAGSRRSSPGKHASSERRRESSRTRSTVPSSMTT